ncbi:MAG TPA: type II secretion system protein [Candidatus Udaeobacter sp.]|nr:type II secretion system protein [Candidatus Udaeobacter sp.]
MSRNFSFSRAFTLIELIVVLAVIAILMSLVYPMYTSISERAKATKDLSNLRQIGLATQTYMNDSDGLLFSPATSWMSQLNPKYFSAWRGFQSPFDKRASSEAGTGTPVSPISYGVNANIYPGGNPITVTKITKPTDFILFAPAQDDSNVVRFQGSATSTAPGVKVNQAASTPGGTAIGGTQNSRTRINACMADLHVESLPWSTFISDAPDPGCACCTVSSRWHPDPCNP